jgi:nucleoside 2-deoxyribosyltransferase
VKRIATPCPIWDTPAAYFPETRHGNKICYDSPRAGGQYEVTSSASVGLENLSEDKKLLLTTWLVDQRRLGTAVPVVHSNIPKQTANFRHLSVRERRDRFLRYLDQKTPKIGTRLPISRGKVAVESDYELLAWTESTDSSELWYLINFSVEEGLVAKIGSTQSDTGSMDHFGLTPGGYDFLDQMDKANPAAVQGFVAMWFAKDMHESYEKGFAPAIADSVYKPLRIDRKEHINKIDDEIIAEIRRSRFVVADFTSKPDSPRGGVYFEAGFAYGLNIPVIWTCRQDMIEHVHFDTRQFNHITWSGPEDLNAQLRTRIGAVIGDGPLKEEGES